MLNPDNYLDRLALNIAQAADRVCEAQENLRNDELAGEFNESDREELRNAIRDIIRDAELLKSEYML